MGDGAMIAPRERAAANAMRVLGTDGPDRNVPE